MDLCIRTFAVHTLSVAIDGIMWCSSWLTRAALEIPAELGGGGMLPRTHLPNLQTSDRSEVGQAAIVNFQQVFFDGILKISYQSHKSDQREVICQNRHFSHYRLPRRD